MTDIGQLTPAKTIIAMPENRGRINTVKALRSIGTGTNFICKEVLIDVLFGANGETQVQIWRKIKDAIVYVDDASRAAYFSVRTGARLRGIALLRSRTAAVPLDWRNQPCRTDRLRAGLQAALARLSEGFNTGIETACSALQPSNAEVDELGRNRAYVARFAAWRESARYRNLLPCDRDCHSCRRQCFPFVIGHEERPIDGGSLAVLVGATAQTACLAQERRPSRTVCAGSIESIRNSADSALLRESSPKAGLESRTGLLWN